MIKYVIAVILFMQPTIWVHKSQRISGFPLDIRLLEPRCPFSNIYNTSYRGSIDHLSKFILLVVIIVVHYR